MVMTMCLPTPEFRAARYSLLAFALAGLLAACGNSGGAKTVTVASTTVQTAPAPAEPVVTPDLKTLGPVIAEGIKTFHTRFASGARQGTLAQRRALLAKLSDGFTKADQAVAAAAASSPAGATASGLPALQGVTAPMAKFLADAKAAKSPAKVAGVFCNVRALDRLYRTVAAAEQQVNVEAAQLGIAAAPFTPDKPTRGAWNVVVGSGCVGALRDQFTALSAAAKKKQAAKAAAAADAIRASMLQVQSGMGPGLAETNPAAVSRAATALRDLARLEAQYMALVARSWRNKTVSGAARKRYEAEIPNAFKRAADRVKRSGVLVIS
jgi:hypothetical protein